jgi:hypothetical protein
MSPTDYPSPKTTCHSSKPIFIKHLSEIQIHIAHNKAMTRIEATLTVREFECQTAGQESIRIGIPIAVFRRFP